MSARRSPGSPPRTAPPTRPWSTTSVNFPAPRTPPRARSRSPGCSRSTRSSCRSPGRGGWSAWRRTPAPPGCRCRRTNWPTWTNSPPGSACRATGTTSRACPSSAADPARWHDALRAPAPDDIEVLMTGTGAPRVLVTGATGRVGRVVVDLLVDAGVPVRALTHRGEAPGTLPVDVEVVPGDLTEPESLDAALRGVGTVFLVWTAPPATAPAVVERLATHTRRVVFLSAPHRTPHPFFQQPNPMAVLYADIEKRIADA